MSNPKERPNDGQEPHSGNGLRYQIFPDLSPEEEKVMRASIKEEGVLIPIIKDEQGNIVEGHQRQRLAGELGVPCPEEVRHFKSAQEKFEFALNCNRARRCRLTGRQKRHVIAAYLKGDPEISNNWLGEILGVSSNTVEDERRKLEATSQIAKLDELRGKDGKKRPAQKKAARAKPKAAIEAKKEPVRSEAGLAGTQPSDDQFLHIADVGDDSDEESALTPEDLKAVQVFVEAVGGWKETEWLIDHYGALAAFVEAVGVQRVKWILTEGRKKWTQNQTG